MDSSGRSIRHVLEQQSIETWAACRVDMGGGWDLPQFATLYGWLEPMTVNIALNIGVTVEFLPWADGQVKIESDIFPPQEGRIDELNFNSSMGPLMACLATGGVSGVRLVVKSASPPLAGLSASSAALIATLYGLNCLGIFQVRLGSKELVLLAHRIESSLHTCGLQDLAAAVFGGVHAWRWKLTNPYEPFEGTSLVSGDDCRILDDVFCVAYLGSAHDDADATSSRVSAFLSGQGRRHWFDIIRCVHEYAKALEERDWKKAGLCMNRELELRKKCGGLSPLTQQMEAMIEAARTFSCGARHTGRGGGGCVWAIGMPQAIAATRARWQDLCWKIPGAKLLDVRASAKGVCCIRGENVQY